MVDELRIETNPEAGKNSIQPYCTCLAWSNDGNDLFAGYTDSKIRIYRVNVSA